jgi:hypothetical protein
MSSEPLLPSYAAAAEQPRYYAYRVDQNQKYAASSLMEALCFIIFTATAIVSFLWASQSISTPHHEVSSL